MNVLEMAVKQPLTLVAGEKLYRVEFPLAAVIQAEEKLGRSLKSPSDWFSASASDVPVLLAAGLSKHHPNITDEDIAAICDGFNPESVDEFVAALTAMAFPKWMARYQEILLKLEKDREAGKTSPNAPSADAS